MSDEHNDHPAHDCAPKTPVDTSRRPSLAGPAVWGVGAPLVACGNTADAPTPP